MNTSITFDELERRAESTLGYALLAKAARNSFIFLYRATELSVKLDSLVKVLTPEKIQSLTPAQFESLNSQLQQLHRLLYAVGKSEEFQTLRQVPLFGGSIDRLQERAEALSDVIDDLALIGDPSLKRLVSDCVTSIGV
jgi:hypothetical protein